MTLTVIPDIARSPRASGTILGLGLVALTATVVFILSSGSPSAKADNPTHTEQTDSTNFGSAMPSDKFVQSFQQQVSQQLQNALDQSDKAQTDRLHEVEEQQASLREQMLNMQHDMAASHNAPVTSLTSGGDPLIDAPSVHVRHALPTVRNEDLSGLAALNANPTPSVSTGTSNRNRAPEANIAPHGFIEGRMLNGVVAIVGGPERESIVALHGAYRSANGFASQLDGCFALVQGKPELATGRIDFKLSRLTCNFPDGASRTWDTAGWLVDSDGIRGVRATMVENLSRRAAVAAGAGAISALGQRLSQEQYQVTASTGAAGTTGASSLFNGNSAADALGGASSGAANALGQSLGDYYNQFNPTLQIGGGTPVTVVLANDLKVPPSGKSLTQTHVAQP